MDKNKNKSMVIKEMERFLDFVKKKPKIKREKIISQYKKNILLM